MKNWSTKEELMLKVYYDSNMTMKNIATKLDRSVGSICSKINQSGIRRESSKKEEKHFDIILAEVMQFSKLERSQLFEKTRKREVIQFRQLCHYYAKLLTRSSFATIGQFFGNKDHATVINSVKAINNLIDTDEGFLNIHNEILKNIKNAISLKNKGFDKAQLIKIQIKSIKERMDIHSKIELNNLIKNIKNDGGKC